MVELHRIKWRRVALILSLTLGVMAISWRLFPEWAIAPGGVMVLLSLVFPAVVEVVAGLAALAAPVDAPPAPAPRQLPAPPVDFIGREAEVRRVRRQVGRRRPWAVLIHGLPGVGKSALAAHLARQLAAPEEDQFYLEIAPHWSAHEIMAHLLHSYRPTLVLPEAPPAVAALYRDQLHTRRALLVLDNVHRAEQVTPLLHPHLNLIVVAQHRFSLPRLITLALKPLAPRAAEQLLLRLAPRLGDRAPALAALCGYLPLALRLTGSFLQEREALPVDDYLHQLADSTRRLEHTGVAPALAMSVQALTDDMRTAWRQLSVFAGPFDAAEAATVLAQPLAEAQRLLSELERLGLVAQSAEEGRFHLHSLVRLLAAQALTPEERWAAEARQASAALARLRAADAQYLATPDGWRAALARLEADWANVCAGQAWAAEHAAADPTARALCAAFGEAGPHCLAVRLGLEAQVRWYTAARTAAEGDAPAQARITVRLAAVTALSGAPQQAIALYEDAWAAAQTLGDPAVLGLAAAGLGQAYRLRGELRGAVLWYTQALPALQAAGDPRAEAITRARLGEAQFDLGQYAASLASAEQAIQLAERHGAAREIALGLGCLGRAHIQLGAEPPARAAFTRQLILAQQLGDTLHEAQALGGLGLAALHRRDTREALRYFQRQAALARKVGDWYNTAVALGNQAQAHAQLGQIERAEGLLRERWGLARTAGDMRGQISAAGNLGNLYLQTGRWPEAARCYLLALGLARAIGHQLGAEIALHNLRRLARRRAPR